MSYFLNVSAHRPSGLWMLNGSLTDLSGNGVPAATVGSPIAVYSSGLVASANYSSILDNTRKVKIPFKYYQPGFKSNSFSLEAWTFKRSDDATIMSSTGTTDGLAWIGGNLCFTLRFATAPQAQIIYTPDVKKSIHVVGVYQPNGMALYINGSLFSKLDFSPEQIADDFVASDLFLYSGEGGGVLLNALATYDYALTAEKIMIHYRAGRDTVPPNGIPSVYGGSYIPLTQQQANVFLNYNFGPQMSWELGSMNNLVVSDGGKLSQQYVDGQYSEGIWTYMIETGFEPTMHSMRVSWEGYGVVAEASVDGTEWYSVNNDSVAPILGYGTTNIPQMFIRFIFPENSAATLETLNLVGVRDQTINAPNIVIESTPLTTFREEWSPIENRVDYGVYVGGTGESLKINSSTAEDYTGDKTIEFWYYSESGSFSTSYTGGWYENGISAPVVARAGMWTCVHVSNPTGISSLTIGGDVIVGRISAYPTVLTAQQILDIYRQYTGKLITPITGVGSVGFSSPSVKAYSSDWAITGSG